MLALVDEKFCIFCLSRLACRLFNVYYYIIYNAATTFSVLPAERDNFFAYLYNVQLFSDSRNCLSLSSYMMRTYIILFFSLTRRCLFISFLSFYNIILFVPNWLIMVLREKGIFL